MIHEAIQKIIEADQKLVDALDDGPVKNQIEQVREIYRKGNGGENTPEARVSS